MMLRVYFRLPPLFELRLRWLTRPPNGTLIIVHNQTSRGRKTVISQHSIYRNKALGTMDLSLSSI